MKEKASETCKAFASLLLKKLETRNLKPEILFPHLLHQINKPIRITPFVIIPADNFYEIPDPEGVTYIRMEIKTMIDPGGVAYSLPDG